MLTSTPACSASPKERVPEYVLSPDVIFVKVDDGSARLLNMAGSFHAIPAIGARMLQAALTNGADEAAMCIADDYGVTRTQVANDLAAFLGELEKKGLLLSQGGRWHRFSSTPVLARLLLRPSLKATHRLLRSPEAKARILLALARLSFALFGWTRTIAVWKDAHARFPAKTVDEPDADTLAVLDRSVRAAAASHPVSVACKERALCSWALARAAGLEASVIVGVFLFPMAGHCWCEAGTQVVGDDRERCCEFSLVGRW